MTARWLTPDDTADYIGVRVHELPRLVRDGKLPAPSWRPPMTRTDLCFKIAATLSGVASGQFAMDLADDVLDTIEQSGLRVVPIALLRSLREGIDAEFRPGAFSVNFPELDALLAASPFAPGDGT